MTLQSDPSWLPSRRGKLTASRMRDAMAKLKKGGESAERRRLKIELLAERVSDYAVQHYVTPPMQRGLDWEAPARDTWEERTGQLAMPAALVDHPTIEHFAATPDGFIGSSGLLEIKVPTMPTFLEWRMAGVVPPEHVPQLCAQLACTRRQWTEFVAYCPELPEPHDLFVRRFEPTAEQIAEVEAAAVEFLGELEAMFEKFTEEGE